MLKSRHQCSACILNDLTEKPALFAKLIWNFLGMKFSHSEKATKKPFVLNFDVTKYSF